MAYYVLATGALGMALVTTGVNLWYFLWMLSVGDFVVMMYLNRGSR